MSQKVHKNADQFEHSRLKVLARTNCLPINSVLYRMKLGPSYCCVLCVIQTLVKNAYAPALHFPKEIMLLNFIGLSPFLQIQVTIGVLEYTFNDQIWNLFDDECKLCLKELRKKSIKLVLARIILT